MDNLKPECTLCDNIVCDKNFKLIDDAAKEILDILLLKSKPNETKNVMCTTCSSKLIAAYNFKTKCLYTNNSIRPYVDFKNPKPVDIKQIYAKERRSKQGSSMLDDREVCRLCLQPMTGDHKLIQEVPVGCIQIYIPEINFEATTNPVICIKCYDALHVHSTFIKNCVDVDKKRNGDAENCGEIFLNDQCIKIEEIEVKSEETGDERLFETVCDIKKEDHDEWDTYLQSQIDLTDTEESKSLHDFDDREQTTVANYQSEECSFKSISEREEIEIKSEETDEEILLETLCDIKKDEHGKGDTPLQSQIDLRHTGKSKRLDDLDDRSNQKGRLKQHQLTHKDPSEVKMFKCTKCTFETKHKKSFINHYLTHKVPSEVRMFQCDECDYKSKQKSHVKQHKLIHKDPSEAQMYECNECLYRTIRKNNLRRHQLTHKDPAQVKMFKCDKCTYETKCKGNLIKHCLRHSDPLEVQMFECGECDYGTIYKRSLMRHQLRHRNSSEVQMFKCAQCIFTTKHKISLVRHCSTLKH